MKLSDKLWPIAKEYTRQVADLFGVSEWHWVGTDDDGAAPLSVCDFGGCFFLALDDMQVIIDRLDEWVKRYGSKDAVAQEINDWFDWWLGDVEEPNAAWELWESRAGVYLRTRPRISLEHWLMGCPRERKEPTVYSELETLRRQREVVSELIGRYREARSLWNILDSLGAEIKEKEAIVKEREAEMMKELRKGYAYKSLEEAIEDERAY